MTMTMAEWDKLPLGTKVVSCNHEGKVLVKSKPRRGAHNVEDAWCTGFGFATDKEDLAYTTYVASLSLYEEPKPATLIDGSAHYKKTKYQPLEVLLDWQDSWPVDVRFHLGCVLKYLGRMGKKDEAIMELKKIKHYAEEAIRVLELPTK